MALTLEVEGKTLAFGLNWAAAPTGRGSFGKLADLGVRFRASHKAYLPEQGQYGFLEAGGRLPGRVKKGMALSGAALFAALVPPKQDSIFVYTIEAKKKAVIVAITDGRIYQDLVVLLGNGLDKSDSGAMRSDGSFEISSEAALGKIQAKIDQIYNETGKTFVAYGNFYHTFPESAKMDLEMLLEGGDQASLTKFSDPRAALKIGGAAAVVCALMFGYQGYKERERKRKELEAMQQQVDPMETYRSNLRSVLSQARFTPADAEKLLKPMVSREVGLGGWQLQKIECTNAGACDETWGNINGTAKSFADANQQQGKILSYADGLDSFHYGYTVESKTGPLDPSSLPLAESFAQTAVLTAQQLGAVGVVVTWAKTPSIDFTLPAGVTAGMVRTGEGVARSTVEVTGPAGLLRDTLAAVPGNLMITGLTLAISDELDSNKFTIKGYYYVKK